MIKETPLILATKTFVQQELANAEGGHDWFHIERVYKNALLIAEEEDVNLDIIALGALLHDIGKTVTLSESMIYTATGTMVNHDSLTLELCASALKQLSQTNPRYADILRHIWTCEKEQFRYSIKLNIASQIQRFDREDSKEHS